MIRQSYEMIRCKGKQGLEDKRFLLKPTLMIAAVYLLGISAILRADFYFQDDLGRACFGEPGWGFSRHLANLMSKVLHTGGYLSDISPFPQILAVFIMALTSAICVYAISGDRKMTTWQGISVIPLGLSPFFLQCLSYKYDAPYMAMSVLLSVLPLVISRRKTTAYLISTALCTIGMCTSYQASSGIFPMLVIMVGVSRWVYGEDTKQVLKFYGISAAGYLAGMLLFRLFFMAEYDGYASTEVAAGSDLLSTALGNYKHYISILLDSFNPSWLVLSFLIGVFTLWSAVSRSKHSKILTLLVAASAMLFMFLLSFGVYPFLEKPLFSVRSMYGIGCCLAFWGIFSVSRPKAFAPKLGCLILSWCFFIFAFTYGNAQAMQVRYTDFRISAAMEDVAKCQALSEGEDVALQITGSIGYAPGVENLKERYPMIEQLVRVNFQNGWWGEYASRNYYGLPEMRIESANEPPEGTFAVVADNYYHTVREREGYIWIELH